MRSQVFQRGHLLLGWALSGVFLFASGGCQSAPSGERLATVGYIDLQRFMGDWYVLGNIPTRIEKGAHNAVESYRLAPDGRVLTTFTFREGSFDGPLKRYEPVGFIKDRNTNATWGMRFVWPFKADYRIAYIEKEYRLTIVAREKRDYVWLLARTPTVSDAEYQKMLNIAEGMGYDVSKIQKVPQRWPDQ